MKVTFSVLKINVVLKQFTWEKYKLKKTFATQRLHLHMNMLIKDFYKGKKNNNKKTNFEHVVINFYSTLRLTPKNCDISLNLCEFGENQTK